MIARVIDIVNRQFVGIHSEAKVYGIAESILRTSGTVNEKLPGIIYANGEIEYVGIDDVSPLIIYHKINSVASVQFTNGVGDARGSIQNTYNAAAFVYWDMARVGIPNDNMLMVVQSNIPLQITGIKDIQLVTLRLSGGIINSYQVFASEYSLPETKLLPQNKMFLQVNYIVEITFKPECFRKCVECS